MARNGLGPWAFVAALACPLSAAAHPAIEEARGLADGAEFEQAIDVLDRAEAADDLALDDAIALLRLRAVSEFALGRDRALGRDLSRLAALGWEPPAGDVTLPPALLERFAAVRAQATPLAVTIDVERSAGAVRLVASLRGDVDGLVRTIRFHTRLAGGTWLTSEGSDARALAPGDSTVEYFAEVIGPGGAVLLHEGSEGEPLSARPLAITTDDATEGHPEGAALGGGESPEDRDGLSVGAWIAIAGGAVAAVALAVVLIVLLTASSDTNELGSPSVSWPP